MPIRSLHKWLSIITISIVLGGWNSMSSAALVQDIYQCNTIFNLAHSTPPDCSNQLFVGSIEFSSMSGNTPDGVTLSLYGGEEFTGSNDIQTADWSISSTDWLLTSFSLGFNNAPNCTVFGTGPFPCGGFLGSFGIFSGFGEIQQPGLFIGAVGIIECDVRSSSNSPTCLAPDSASRPTYYNFVPQNDVLSPVPVPATCWLFGTALIGLVGFNKRRKAA